jgi:hypothetical protein
MKDEWAEHYFILHPSSFNTAFGGLHACREIERQGSTVEKLKNEQSDTGGEGSARQTRRRIAAASPLMPRVL